MMSSIIHNEVVGTNNHTEKWLSSTVIQKLNDKLDDEKECSNDKDSIMITSREEASSIHRKIQRFREIWEDKSLDNHSSTSAIGSIDDIPKFRENELIVIRLLGRGAFADVHEGYFRDNPNQTFAIKRLRESVLDEDLENSIEDIAFETSILASLKHENIIHLHKINKGNTMELLRGGRISLVLELLDETLHTRHKKWQKQWSRKKLLRGLVSQSTVIARLENVVLGIVSAMVFLHSNQIIYRDIKPLNIGFDKHDNVKIFDFGFARICNEERSDRLMTGGIGTPRYMAPEIANYEEQYSFPADVYSFSIMLWQIVTSQTPFADIKSASQLSERVTIEHVRPKLSYIRSKPLRQLIASGWSTNPSYRPSFYEIEKRLRAIIVEYHLSKCLPSFLPSCIIQRKDTKSMDKWQRRATINSCTSLDDY